MLYYIIYWQVVLSDPNMLTKDKDRLRAMLKPFPHFAVLFRKGFAYTASLIRMGVMANIAGLWHTLEH